MIEKPMCRARALRAANGSSVGFADGVTALQPCLQLACLRRKIRLIGSDLFETAAMRRAY
jgi:hypothetical protein